MKRFTVTSVIILSVCLAMAIVGAIFQDITWTGTFNPTKLSEVLQTIGYIGAALSGIVLVALGVSGAIKSGDAK